MTAFQLGETVTEISFTYNESNNCLTNVDSIVISVLDIKDDIIINEENMTNISTGVYKYNYNISPNAYIGLWKIIVKITHDSIISIRNDSFRVMP